MLLQHGSSCINQRHAFGHAFFGHPFLAFVWVTARYLWHWKCQCKCEKGTWNVVQKVETLLKDKNAVAVFFHLHGRPTKTKIET